MPAEELEHLRKEMVEATNGRVGFEKLRELYFVDRELYLHLNPGPHSPNAAIA